jgi:AcrR family transcriptional regulator
VGPRAEKGEATRARLIEVAGELFGERGYDETPIEEVLERTGVSKGALYHHFPSKEALFEAVYRTGEQACLEEIAKAALKEPDPLAMLRAGCQMWLDLAMDPHVHQIALIDGPAVLGWQRWREIDEEYAFGLTKHVLQEAADAGAIRGENVDMTAHLALAMLGEAAMVIAKATDKTKAREEAGAAVDRMVDALAVPDPTVRRQA